MASQGKVAVGAAMIIQQSTGLRPSELLALQREHIYMPPDCISAITLRLGAVVSTKVKRETVCFGPSLATNLLPMLCYVSCIGVLLMGRGFFLLATVFTIMRSNIVNSTISFSWGSQPTVQEQVLQLAKS